MQTLQCIAHWSKHAHYILLSAPPFITYKGMKKPRIRTTLQGPCHFHDESCGLFFGSDSLPKLGFEEVISQAHAQLHTDSALLIWCVTASSSTLLSHIPELGGKKTCLHLGVMLQGYILALYSSLPDLCKHTRHRYMFITEINGGISSMHVLFTF